ncbi:MAG TPA: ParB/RepB/Spo0J family partition protein [Pseudoxanthomonas sp.]
MLQTIPLSQLTTSSHNVRKRPGSVKDLAASIAAHGLRQNLTVIPRADTFEVSAGGRRLRALQLLAQEGRLPATLAEGIPCMLTTDDAASEVSLAENVVREAMHPADEFDAFLVLANEGKTSDEIAERFGCEPKHVEQRLRLARVAPEILDEYRAGNANLEQMQALALTDDTTLQRAAWKAGEKSQWKRNPRELRGAITQKEIDGDSALGKFVGIKAYEEAGGVARKDLFEDKIYFPDHLLLESLALTKLQKSVDKVVKEGWKWGEARLSFEYSDKQKFGTAPSNWKGSKQTWEKGTMASAGVVVSIGYNGQAEVTRGLVRPEDRKEAAQAAGGADKIVGGKTAKPAKKPGELSFAAVQRLQAEGTVVVRNALCDKPDIAIALLVSELAYRHLVSTGFAAGTRWVFIGREQSNRAHGKHWEDAAATKAGEEMENTRSHWLNRLPKSLPKLREWSIQLAKTDPEELRYLLAFLVARELECVNTTPTTASEIRAAADAVGVSLSDAWRPSAGWLAGLPKATILEMVREANGKGGKAAADKLAKLSKADLPKAALDALPKGWLPKPLAPPKARAKLDGKQKASGERDDAEG